MIAKNQRANGDGSGSAKGGKVILPWLAPLGGPDGGPDSSSGLKTRRHRVSHPGFAN
jgi:hypothetical protein